jgi:hypothetical protein
MLRASKWGEVIGIYSIHMHIYIHIHVCSVAVRTTLVHLVQIPNIGKCIQPIFRCQSHDMHVQFGFQFSVYFRGVLWPRTRINIQCCCLLVTFLLKPSAKLIESLKLKAFGEWRVVWLWESLQFCTRMGMEGALRFLAGTNAETLDAKFAFWVFSLPKIQAPLTSLPTFFPECKDDTHTIEKCTTLQSSRTRSAFAQSGLAQPFRPSDPLENSEWRLRCCLHTTSFWLTRTSC